ncbi:GTPase activating protein [Acanthamoeba castellanii str. Neff]|uniref:GTPase activating protein n=1 Tax=Acanthamoeba castellanii (strain ATCC 30010 / Neff) TaxID=1257118 RepID=L8HCF3_ACACF|nr:GTPase activating protein [Acanthamoeba castellanii str. Neff]ELR23204.1 GTPase activating protein [Acanthamoeba castellanii str. Neff]
MEALRADEIVGAHAKHLHLRMELGAAEMMLEQELEKMTTEELKRIIEEGDLEWNEGVCTDEVDHEHNNNTNGGGDHALLSSHADVEMRGQTSGGASWPVVAGEESEAKLKRETARDIVYFVQTQGFEGIAEEEWDSDELDEIEELKKEIDRIQEELKFQRELKEFERRLCTMSNYELKVLVSRMEEKQMDRYRRRRGGGGGHSTRERSYTASNDGQYPDTSHIAVPPGLLDDDREGRFFDEMCGTLRAMLHKALADRDAQNGDDGDDDEVEHEREVDDDDDDDENDKDGSSDGTKRSKKERRKKKKKKTKKKIGSLLNILSSKGRQDGKRKAKEAGDDDVADGPKSDEVSDAGEQQVATSRGSRIAGLGKKQKKGGSVSKREKKERKKAAKGSKRKQRKEARGESSDDDGSGSGSGSGRKGSANKKIASMLPFPLSLSRSKLPADLDQAGIIARPAIFDDSLFEGWLYRRKEKGMRKTWQKRWGVILRGRFMLYDDKQKEKLEEWDLMFVKAQPGVAKMKRKDSRAKEASPGGDNATAPGGRTAKRPRSASLSSSLSASTPSSAHSSPYPPQRQNSIAGLSATTPSPPSSGRTSPRGNSPYSSSSSVVMGTTSPSPAAHPATSPARTLSATSGGSSGSFHFFELMTREETVRFLSPSERDNEEWVEIINRERDTLVTCMLLAGDDSDSAAASGDKAGHGDGADTTTADAVDKDGKLGITESRRLLREIIEAELQLPEEGEQEEDSESTTSDDTAAKEERPAAGDVEAEVSAKGKEAETSAGPVDNNEDEEGEGLESKGSTKTKKKDKKKGSEAKRKSRSASDAKDEKKDRTLRWSSNLYCADCGEPQPEWASINYGIFICLACSGIHRSLGVRSVVLDRWRLEDVELIRSVGNRKFNQQWQQRVERILEGPYGEEFRAHFASAAEHQYCHLGPDASPELRRKYLRIKYAGDLASVLGVPRQCTIIIAPRKEDTTDVA